MSKRKQKRKRFRNRQKERKQQLNEQRRRQFAALVAGLDPDRILYLPLDISKNVHWMRADTGAGRVVHPPKDLLANRTGYAYWQQCVLSWLTGGQFDLLVIGHEPTGIYHKNWCRHILSNFAPYLAKGAHPQLLYRFINPYQSKLERQKLTLRPRNTDPMALLALSNLLRQGQGNPATLPDPKPQPLPRPRSGHRGHHPPLPPARRPLRLRYRRPYLGLCPPEPAQPARNRGGLCPGLTATPRRRRPTGSISQT